MKQIKLDTQLCTLNGIHLASVACTSLAQSLTEWLAQEDEEQGDNKATKKKETAMIELAKEELERYSHAYQQLLEHQTKSTLLEYCGHYEDMMSIRECCIHSLRDYFLQENFALDSKSFEKAEADERLERILLEPLKESILISQLHKCDAEVSLLLCKELSALLAATILHSLWSDHEAFTDWGSLLLSKQVRLLQTHVQGLVEPADQDASYVPPSFWNEWEKLSQVVTILQLEKPSDWSIYRATSVLTPDELKKTLSLRKDFSVDAIAAVCAQQKAS
jgi:hypothetical protein